MSIAVMAEATADEPGAPPPPVVTEAPSTSASASASTPEKPADPPAPPKTFIGLPIALHGGGVPKGVKSALLALQPAIDACYAYSIREEAEGEGSMELRLEIDATSASSATTPRPGRVVSATIGASRELSSTLRTCVHGAVAGVPVEGTSAAPLEVLLPMAFSRGLSDDFVRPASACPASLEEQGEMNDDLRGALRDRATRAAFCFKRGPASGEPATLKAGTMELTLRIADDGSVCGIAAIGDTFGRPSLTSCILETMSGDFASSPPDGVVDVTIPLEFKGT